MVLVGNDALAARSSTRNFKTLKQQEEERVAAEKEAQRRKEEQKEISRSSRPGQTVEKVKFLGPKNGWGFVSKSTPYYSPQGENLGDLEAGTLFKYHDVKSTSKDDMLLARLRDKSGWHGPYLLPCTEVAAYEGDPEQVDIQIVADLRNYFLLKGEYDTHRDELLENEYRRNPHFEAYRQAAENYRKSAEAAGKMEDDASKLTGAAKTRAYDGLRSLKYEQEKLKAELQAVGEKYRAWKEAHPVDESKIGDEKLTSLRNRMDEIKSRVAELVPPER